MPVTTRSQSKSKIDKCVQQGFVETLKTKKTYLKPKPPSQTDLIQKIWLSGLNASDKKSLDEHCNNMISKSYNDITCITTLFWFRNTLSGLFKIIQAIEIELADEIVKNGFNKEAKKLFYTKLGFITQIMQTMKQNIPIVRHMKHASGINELCMAAYKTIPELYEQLDDLSKGRKPTTIEEENIKSMLISTMQEVNEMLTPFLSSDKSQMLIQNK